MITRIATSILILSLTATLPACSSSYAAPGRGANLAQLSNATPESAQSSRDSQTDANLYPDLDKKPLAQLPTAVAVIRVQAGGYRTKTNEGWGNGQFSVVFTPDTEDLELVPTWEKLKSVEGISPISRLLLPTEINSEIDLRMAAAKLHADMLLIYTVDTTFYQQDQAVPLSVITLGLAPDHTTRVTSTVSAMLIDTRNGYVYGTAEASDRDDSLTTGWTIDSQFENARIKTEKAAFKKFTPQVVSMWNKVVQEYGPKQ